MYKKENRWAYNPYYVMTETKKCIRFVSRLYDLNLKPFCSRNFKTIFLLLFVEFDNILNYMPSLAPQRFTIEKSGVLAMKVTVHVK
jgi:predicted CDP-diglyceride synthetase/phosphatidate cytidylyltransferase